MITIETKHIETVAKNENISAQELTSGISKGHIVIVKSDLRDIEPIGIGKGLRTKINSNIGTSNNICDEKLELEKLHASIEYGADTVMDLSTGGDIRAIRKEILRQSSVPVGTVPIYEILTKTPDVAKITKDHFLDSIRQHIEDGVDFITVHCGVTKNCIPLLKDRIMGVVSRGGSFLVKWMLHHNKENPLFEYYDEILKMAKEHNVVLSLGDGMRPGAIADAGDKAQIEELKTLGALAKRARDSGVQVIIEGPGHVPLHKIKEQVEMQKEICDGAPFYVLGPLTTDIGVGYDHITGAIGGALAATYGADFLCYLTPTEHAGLPNCNDTIEGVIASKIAAHSADIAKGIPNADVIDNEMSKARSLLDWETMYKLSYNPKRTRQIRQNNSNNSKEECTMCGDLCSAKINKECRELYK
jgi:phosphomethylpyrimidine synthase